MQAVAPKELETNAGIHHPKWLRTLTFAEPIYDATYWGCVEETHGYSHYCVKHVREELDEHLL